MNQINKSYSNFLEQYDWNYFITCRSPYRLNTLTADNWVKRIINKSNKVDKVFYVVENDKADISSKHVHMLISTNTDMTYNEIRFGLGKISVGDYQEINNKSYLCSYVTKHISSLENYNFIFRESL